jgi:6-phosphofructokinase
MAKRIGLLTAGGDAPGSNVCLKAIVVNATDQGYEVVGIRKGWEGLVRFDPSNPATHAENGMVLTKSRVRDIDRTPGSFLHSSRINPGRLDPSLAPESVKPANATKETLDLTPHVKRAIEVLGLEALIVLGDHFSLDYAARLSQEGVPVIGIPKSVHNDICGSDYAIGFSTALASGVRLIHGLRAMAGSREEIAVVEMFGRTFGLTTMLIGVLAGADRILIPEVPFDPERLAALLMEDKRSNPNNYAILTLSEALRIDPAKADRYNPELYRRTNNRHVEPDVYTISAERSVGLGAAGGGPVVTEILESLLGERLIFQPLTYLLRLGEPDGQDMLGAMNFAMMATNLIAAKKMGRLVAYQHAGNYIDLPIEVVTERKGNIDVAAHYNPQTFRAKPEILWAARV